MDDRCIALYDSGAGGLNLLYKLHRLFPKENLAYFSDEKNFPYGNKTKEEISKIASEKTKRILTFSPKAVIFACNTLSTSALKEYTNFPVKVFGVSPKVVSDEKTLIICTKLTAESDFISNLIKENDGVDIKIMNGLAEEVETWVKGGKKPDVKKRFKETEKNYDSVVLGCTHYLFLKEEIAKIFPLSKISDGTDDTLAKIKGWLTTNYSANNNGELCFANNKDKECFLRFFKGF